jgi:AraC family transcriptional regulator
MRLDRSVVGDWCAERRPSPGSSNPPVGWIAISAQHRSGLPRGECSFWLQVRGTSCLCAREGTFRLGPGDWIVLDRGSATEVSNGAHGLMLGVVLTGASSRWAQGQAVLPGRGRMSRPMMRQTMHLWRQGHASGAGSDFEAAESALKALFAQIALFERDYDGNIARCPGRSISSKRRVFARMQRARLLLEGNRHRIVRLTELSELTSFSIWYLSKKYLEIYEESPQAASLRLRLQHAGELLVETDWPIKRVAGECGFDSSASFGRTFRRMYGQTPSQQRMSAAEAASRTDDPKRFATLEQSVRKDKSGSENPLKKIGDREKLIVQRIPAVEKKWLHTQSGIEAPSPVKTIL